MMSPSENKRQDNLLAPPQDFWGNKLPLLSPLSSFLRDWASGGIHRLILQGPSGAGKTYLVKWFLRQVGELYPGYHFAFYRAIELADLLNPFFEPEYPEFRRYQMIVIDDFTKPKFTEQGTARLNMLLDEFFENYLGRAGLIITTDKKDWDGLGLDPALVRRVREGAKILTLRR